MAHIPEDSIEHVKQNTDLVALIQSRGVRLTKQGTNWTGLCPFHGDKKTPNFIVTSGKGLFRCMAGKCGKSGNAIQFVQWHDKLNFREAYELLATKAGEAPLPKAKGTSKNKPTPQESPDAARLLEQAAKHYHDRLFKNPKALDYLKTRGLDDERMLREFRVGFADRTLGRTLPDKQRVEGRRVRGHLEELGVFRKKSGHEHLNGCVVVPVCCPQTGTIQQLYGRRIERHTPKEKRHLYLARPMAGILNPKALESREIILTESILDALTFYQHGMKAVTCAYGTNHFTAELLEAITGAGVESVRLAYDADEAGDKAAAGAAARLMESGIECHQIRFPRDMDANSYALEQGGEAMRHLVNKAEWLGAGAPQSKKSTKAPNKVNGTSSSSSLAAKAAKGEEGSKSTDEPTPSPKPTPTPVRKGEFWELVLGDRTYRIGGLEKNQGPEALKISLRVMEASGLFHLDSLDLVRDSDRRKFTDRAHEETHIPKDILRRDLGRLLLALEQVLEEQQNTPTDEEEAVELTPEEEAEALEFLKDPKLIDRLLESFEQAGTVGESNNLLAAYLAATSRKLDKPLAVIIQSTSAAGKSTLMEAVLSFFPKEEQIKYSAMTGQSLYYLGEKNLQHKILAIVEEEGAEKASYALKLLQSEQELRIASTGKDPHSGRMETQEYHVEGPASIILTTTSIDIDEEFMNRCLIITINESREQTKRIHELQRLAETLEGLRLKKKREAILKQMQNLQRLLKPVSVVNEYAKQLTFTDEKTRTRRDHQKYLTLIRTITLLHQYQRPLEEDSIAGPHIKTTIEDIEAANKIAPEVLGRALDELPPQTRHLLEALKTLIRQRMEERDIEQSTALFSRREIREATGWSYMQVKRHLDRLLELEYVAVRHGRNGLQHLYELLIDAREPEGVYHIGLIDTEKLKKR